MLTRRSSSLCQPHVPQIGHTLGIKCIWLCGSGLDPYPILVLHLWAVASKPWEVLRQYGLKIPDSQ